MQNHKNLAQQERKRTPLSYLSIPLLLNGPFFFLGCWSLRYWPTLPQAPLKDSGRYCWGWSIAVKSCSYTCSSCLGFLQLLSSQTTKQNHQVPEGPFNLWAVLGGKVCRTFLESLSYSLLGVRDIICGTGPVYQPQRGWEWCILQSAGKFQFALWNTCSRCLGKANTEKLTWVSNHYHLG